MSGILTDEESAALAVTADTPPEQVEQQAEQANEAEAQAAAERARDEQGRFVAKEPTEGEQEQQQEAEQRQVPQQALHAEREKRKGIEAQLKAAQEQLAGIQALRAKITAPVQPQTPPNPAPDAQQQAADDPNGVEHLRARLAALEGHTQQSQQREQLAQADDYEMRVLSQQATADEESFRKTQPDYDAAINHLVGARLREYALYGVDPVSAQQLVRGEAADIVRTAISQGKSPAEMSYQIAFERGYRPAQGQQSAQQQQQQAPANSAQAILDAVAKGRAANKAPGQGGGGSPSELSATTIAAMSDDEFAALYASPEGRKMIDAL
jgi:hypothetical protein